MSTNAVMAPIASLAEALAILAQGRDAVAWSFICEHAVGKITRLCNRLTGEPSLSDDAVQETLIQIRDDAGQFKPRSTDPNADAMGWIMRIATNTSLQLLRQRDRAQRRDQRAGQINNSSGSQRDEVLEQHEIAVLLRQELAELSEPFRHAIVLHVMEGVGLADVAAAQDVPIGTVKSRIHRGLERLRKRLNRFAFAGSITAITSCLQNHLIASDAQTATFIKYILSNSNNLLNSTKHTTSNLPLKGTFMVTKLAVGITAAFMVSIILLSISQEQDNPTPVTQEQKNLQTPEAKSMDLSEDPNNLTYGQTLNSPFADLLTVAPDAKQANEINVVDHTSYARSGFSCVDCHQRNAEEKDPMPPLPRSITREPHQTKGFQVGFLLNKEKRTEQWKETQPSL